ncbi:TonB-dependent receptor [Parasulfuritortus cantonensis]|uniref:TonB-dependent receptor n=1 Tax=Parasulfuritortus cantonensis TaxID=2528202 RepID=A0A4R1BDR2_9PROT|nr:TonB-dependent receptor [Parasulfuritortus cantonensis]TCJ15177.1 TonB-dependent receptor [Parasulfuritortus cantonensis]
MPKPTPKHRVRLAVLALALSCHAGLAQAARFDIPAQPLASALLALAGQAGVQLVFSPDLVERLPAPALHGDMAVEEALRRLLAGSGLAFRSDGGQGYAVVRPASEPHSALPVVVVTATRTEQRIEDVPASVSVIGAADIARRQPQLVADLLRDVEGVDVADYASLAATETIRLRGVGGSFAGSTSQVLLDGMPLESPVSGIHFGLKALAPEDIERIEVVRGPASALYGPSSMGGVVNLLSKRWQGDPGAELQLGIGSHDAARIGAAAGGSWDAVDIRLSASHYLTDGYVAQPDPDPWGAKDLGPRAGRDRKVGLAMAVRPAANQEISLGYRNAQVESDWLGGHPNYNMDDEVEAYDLGYRYEPADWAVLKLRYRKLRQIAHILFDDDYVNGNTGSLAVAEIDDRIDDSDSVDLQSDLRLGRADTVTVGYSHNRAKYTSRWQDVIYADAGESVSKSRLDGVFVQDEHRFGDAVTVLAGGRWDRYRMDGDTKDGVRTGNDSSDSLFNPRVGLRYRLSAATSLYATAGTAYVPALNSLKFRSGSAWLNNPDLEPEKSVSYEVGVNHRIGPASVRAALFHTDYRDKISSIQTSSGKWQFQNIGKVRVNGFEFGVDAALGAWSPYLNFSYTDSRIVDNPSDPLTEGRQLQRVAPRKLNLGVVYAPSDRYYVRLAGRYVGDYYFDDRNSETARNPDHFVADFKAGYRLPVAGPVRRAELSLAVNNLFDRRYREQQYEYMDGRNLWLGLDMRF